MRRAALALLLAMLAMAVTVLPAAATVHEITGMFCAGEHGNHFPTAYLAARMPMPTTSQSRCSRPASWSPSPNSPATASMARAC